MPYRAEGSGIPQHGVYDVKHIQHLPIADNTYETHIVNSLICAKDVHHVANRYYILIIYTIYHVHHIFYICCVYCLRDVHYIRRERALNTELLNNLWPTINGAS